MVSDPRTTLQRLCSERGVDFAALSRLVGRNPAYVQQFVRRGTPRRLPEAERRIIADYFGVSEALLGGPGGGGTGLVEVALFDLPSEAEAGASPADDQLAARMGFDRNWLEQLSKAAPVDLGIIPVSGDSMSPTLGAGDDLLIDRSDAVERMRDGIYVLRLDRMLAVKRLTIHPISRRVTVQSDNPAYADWPDCDPAELSLIGRVIWSGRRIP